ncbi:MAG: response regulator [Anaerolineae bacterium]|nr:response regulator [Anaerolineae bacterium]
MSDLINFYSSSQKPLILVIDDDWLNREMLEAYLSSAGCEVLTSHDGQKALDLVTETPPDLVLLDVRMPGMDGYDVCVHLKSDPATRLIPVIMVTALEREEDKIQAIEAGADDFVTKPFNPYLLMARVRSLLRVKRLHDQLEERNALLRQVLTRYVDESITDIILEDPERHLRLGGDNRFVTIFFADIRGFTGYAEQHRAQAVVKTLNYLFSQLTDLIKTNQGTFDKYVGDEIMAFFGAPISHENDALNAARTALEMQVLFRKLMSEIEGEHLGLGLGIGLHSGEAVVGNIGSERLMSYTVIGDTVNTGRRLQETARPGQTLISRATYQLIEGYVGARPLESRTFAGKSAPVMVYELLSLK